MIDLATGIVLRLKANDSIFVIIESPDMYNASQKYKVRGKYGDCWMEKHQILQEFMIYDSEVGKILFGKEYEELR